jgi:hypothetical protein
MRIEQQWMKWIFNNEIHDDDGDVGHDGGCHL